MGAHPNRLSIPDARGHGASLQVTRHPEQGKIVLSHWRDGVCVASTPIELSEVSDLIGVLADALGDAVNQTTTQSQSDTPTAATRPTILSAIRSWFRPKLAQITELRLVRETGPGPGPAATPTSPDDTTRIQPQK
jgi:hypothetical protein